ncbi:MAG: AMP-binding protein, partial [Myxococcota bacterium]
MSDTGPQPSVELDALFDLVDELDRRGLARSKSSPGQNYDLYYDLVRRHTGRDLVALRWRRRGRGWAELTYDQLHNLCTQRARHWRRYGVRPGAAIAIVLPFGVEFAVALLTAFRMGARPSFIPPQGTALIAARLNNLSPDHVASSSLYAELLAEHADRLIPEQSDSSDSPVPVGADSSGSYGYDADEPCGLFFSPLRRPAHQPVMLSAHDAWSRAVSDSVSLFSLGPGLALAAPGIHPLQSQPGILCATLIAGATYVHLKLEAALRQPGLLFDFPLHSIGITGQLRDAILRYHEPVQASWDHWFHELEAPLEWSAWRDLVEHLHLTECAASSVLFEAASGGSVLSTARRAGYDHLRAPHNVEVGWLRPWTLRDLNGSGQGALSSIGLFTELRDEEPYGPDHVLLTQLSAAVPDPSNGPAVYMYAGNMEPRRCGRVFPTAEIRAAVAELPFVIETCIVGIQSGLSASHWNFALLIFCGADTGVLRTAERESRIEQLRVILRARVGSEFLPERIELYPFYPNRTETGEVDHDWCKLHYVTGGLHTRAQTPVFHHLARLQALINQCPSLSPPKLPAKENHYGRRGILRRTDEVHVRSGSDAPERSADPPRKRHHHSREHYGQQGNGQHPVLRRVHVGAQSGSDPAAVWPRGRPVH